jgi:hypothetical protein
MKQKLFLIPLVTIAFLQSCTKDKCTETYDGILYTAIYTPMSSLRNVQIQTAKNITSNGKIFIKGNYIYLNEINKGFHIIDNTNPANPKNINFVSVPGNLDIAAKGNYLIVDNYVDLLTFDISNPTNIQLVNRKENALPYRIYNYGFRDDSAKGIITNFNKKVEKQTKECGLFIQRGIGWWADNGGVFILQNNGVPTLNLKASNSSGQGGSLSRFAVLNNHLYIANRFNLTPIDISNPNNPIVKPMVGTGEIETIYPFKNTLFIGSPLGMFIYGTTNPDVPNYLSGMTHWRGCDPVVVQNDIAYVTVRSGGPCGGNLSILDVINVSNLSQPYRIKTYTLENPMGVGIYNNTLGVCDGNAGFKIFDATTSNNIQLKKTINTIKPFDVIMDDQVAILIAEDGMYQYNIATAIPTFISKISIYK